MFIYGQKLIETVKPSREESISISPEHSLWSKESLKWNWQAGDSLYFGKKIQLAWRYRDDGVVYAPVFALNVYCENPIDSELKIEIDNAWFTFGLNFTGWRTATIRYHGDMQGKIPEKAAGFRILTPESGEGTIWLDGLMPDGCMYEAIPMPDFQVPYIGDGEDEHAGPGIFRSRMKTFALQPENITIDGSEAQSIPIIRERLVKQICESAVIRTKSVILKDFQNLNLTALNGPPVRNGVQISFMTREAHPESISYGTLGSLILELAVNYQTSQDPDLRKVYLETTRILIDQGWVEGSSLGSLHLLGYALQHHAAANFLMRDVLDEAKLLETVTKSLQWLANTRECLILPAHECDLDYLHTFAQSQLLSLLMLEDDNESVLWVKALINFIEYRISKQTDDKLDGFKWDGGAFHHYGHYPAYAAGAIKQIAVFRDIFNETPFAFNTHALSNVRKSVEAMRISSMADDIPISLSARHPFKSQGWGQQIAEAEKQLGCQPAPASCCYPMNTAALLTHRRPGWMAVIRGFSKYVWSTEIFPKSANRFGAFQGHGSVEIITNKGLAGSGYKPDGWDWRFVPGATSCLPPFQTMLDKGSCMRSRESFAGALSLDGLNGHFSFCMNNDFYLLTARKSVFCFDNVILCLGNDISCWRQNYDTVTTLFQNAIDEEFDCKLQTSNSSVQLRDAVGNVYLLPNSDNLCFYSGKQESLDQITAEPTTGGFARAWLNHGRRPGGAFYFYTILPQVSDLDAEKYAADPTVEILHQDSKIHGVHHKISGISAFSCFEAGEIDHQLLKSVSKPSLIQFCQHDNSVELTICDPDLQWGRGNCDAVTVTLAGSWKTQQRGAISHIHQKNNLTEITIDPDHGRPVKMLLNKIK